MRVREGWSASDPYPAWWATAGIRIRYARVYSITGDYVHTIHNLTAT